MLLRWTKILGEISIEPVMFLQMVGIGCSSVVGDTLFIDRVCRVSLNLTEHSCKNLSSFPDTEKKVDEIVSIYQIYGSLISAGFPILFALYLGSWIDRHGTKIPILLSLFGFICSNLLNTVFSIEKDVSPNIILLGNLPSALTGGIVAFITSVFTFISRRTNESNRSFRIAILEAGWFIGHPLGQKIGSLIFNRYEYIPVFLASASFISCAFVYCLIFMKDGEYGPQRTFRCSETCKDLCHNVSLKETFVTCFRKREGQRRTWIIILIIMVCLRVLAQEGAMGLVYLYTRSKFGWDTTTFSDFSEIEILMRFIGLIIMVSIMKFFRITDSILGIFSSFGYTIVHCIFAFATKGWMMYLGGGFQTFCTLITIVMRAMVSKLVAKDELGKIFSLVAIGEACMPIIAAFLFNPIYSSTIRTFPGAIFAIAAALHGIIFGGFMYLYYTMRGSVKDLPPVVYVSQI